LRTQKLNKGCVAVWPCHLHILKNISLRQKEELWKLKYFTMQKNNLQKNPLKKIKNKTKILQDITITLL
jgi:hypothetical protein